jgi:LemA protein
MLAVVGISVLSVILIYNGLVRLRVQCDNAWADIDVQLKRRHDLVPNVVESVKGYAAHERETLDSVVAARARAMTAQTPGAKAEAEGMLTQALKSLFALAEAYPQLRAVESFTQLQTTLGQIEEAIQNARRYYNAVVRDLNMKIAQFPSNLIASIFAFKPREFFELTTSAEREVPQVRFGTGSGQAGTR